MKSLPPVPQGSATSLKRVHKRELLRNLLHRLRCFIIRPLLVSIAIVVIVVGGILWGLSGLGILSSSWSVTLASSFIVVGVLLALAQYAIPLSSSLTDDQVYEIYRKQIKSTMIGKSGTSLIRTKGLRGREIYALYLGDEEFSYIEEYETIQIYIINEVIYSTHSTYKTEAQKLTIKNRSIEIATFSSLKPGQYIFWPRRFSTPGTASEEEKNQSHYAYEEVFARQITEIDWQYP